VIVTDAQSYYEIILDIAHRLGFLSNEDFWKLDLFPSSAVREEEFLLNGSVIETRPF
jgi:hypothetical protein